MDKNRTSSATWHDNATGLLPGNANNSNKWFSELSGLSSSLVLLSPPPKRGNSGTKVKSSTLHFVRKLHTIRDKKSLDKNLNRPHTQTRIVPFSWLTTKHSQFGTFSQPCSNRTSQIAVPTFVLRKDDRTDSAQEEQLGLPYWTLIWAFCVLVDVSRYLDILTLEIFKNNVGASSILT